MKTIGTILLIILAFAGCSTAPPPVFSPLPPPFPPRPVINIAKRAEALGVVSPPTTNTSSVLVAWDAVTNVAGYFVYEGPSTRNYTNKIDAGSATSIVVSNLIKGSAYYMAATAYTATGLESAYSVEVSFIAPLALPVTNIVSIGNQILTTTDLSLPWTVYTNMPVVTLTNPPGILYFRSSMSISVSNATQQIIRLDGNTMVFTNNPVGAPTLKPK